MKDILVTVACIVAFFLAAPAVFVAIVVYLSWLSHFAQGLMP